MDGVRAGGIVQVALATEDLPCAIAFYRDALGLPLAFEAGPMAFFDAGGVRLLLGPPQPGQRPGGDAIVYLDGGDLDVTEPALAARGVRFEGERTIVQRTGDGHARALRFLRDPDGHVLALLGRVPVGD